MALDPESKVDLQHICQVTLTTALTTTESLKRSDVFYVPIVIVAAIRHEDGLNTQVIGCDAAFQDDQPREGIIDVLDTVAKVIAGQAPNKVDTINQIVVEGAKLI